VLNRVWSDDFPDTIEGVITEDTQFAAYENGRYDRVEPDADCYRALEMVAGRNTGMRAGERHTSREPRMKTTWHNTTLKKLFTHGNHTFIHGRVNERSQEGEASMDNITMSLGIYFEVKDAEIYGGEGTVGYAATIVDISLSGLQKADFTKYAESQKEGMAQFCHVPVEKVRVIYQRRIRRKHELTGRK